MSRWFSFTPRRGLGLSAARRRLFPTVRTIQTRIGRSVFNPRRKR